MTSRTLHNTATSWKITIRLFQRGPGAEPW